MHGISAHPAESLLAEATEAIRVGMRAKGAHGGLPLERALRESRINCTGVGAPPC